MKNNIIINIIIIFSMFIVFSFTACSESPGDVLTDIKKENDNGNYDNLNKYYTRDTVELLDELDKLSGKNRIRKPKEDKKFARGTEWDIIKERTDGDRADVTIKYTSHPVENMKGLELGFKFRKEGGLWKLDMADELRMTLGILKKNKTMGIPR